MSISFGMIYADILMARHALDDYLKNPKLKDVKNMCAYHIQQASEKMLKKQIYDQIKSPDNRQMYTHSLKVLLTYAKKEGINLNVPGYVLKNEAIISDWEAGSRYRLGFSIRVDTLKRALAEVSSWYESLRQHGKNPDT